LALTHAEAGEVVHLHPGTDQPSPGKTAALVKSDRFEAVRLAVPAGTAIAPHRVASFLTLYCVDGLVVLEADREIELHRGDWIYLDRGTDHAVRGIADSVLLLTIMFD
jgi:quercetin dioxygenase-like cupin family protein